MIPDLLAAIRASVRTAVVARVEAYRPEAREADVLLLVQEERTGVDDEREAVAPQRIEGCPVLWPGGGGRSLTMGLAAGDQVLALVRHRSHDEVDSGQEGPLVPASTRRHSYSDVVLLAEYRAPADGAPASSYRSDGQPVLGLPGGEAFHVGASTAALALARDDLVQTALGALKTAIAGAVVVGGDGGASFKASLLAALSSWPTATATARLKVDS